MAGVVGMICFLALIIPYTYKVLGYVIRVVAHLLYFALILVFVVAITCNVHTYRYLGWTPLSLIFGDGIYSAAMRDQDAKEANKAKRHAND